MPEQSSPQAAPGRFDHGHALLIGVGADLPVTAQDAAAIHGVLVDPARAAYPPAQVDLLANEQANREGVLAAFDRLAARVQADPEATAFIYYSGHAGRFERLNQPPAYFLVPYGYDPARLQETAITGAEFTARIEALQPRKLVVFLDCCHASGLPAVKAEPTPTFTKAAVLPDLVRILDQGSGRVIVASSRDDEYSYTGAPYSVFTACLIEALSGRGAVNADGYARILDILIYLFAQVPARAAGPQHPFVKKVLDLGDNFPLCYYAGGAKTAPGLPVIAPTPKELGLTPSRRRRLEQEREGLQAEYDLRSAKVKQMRAAFAIEAGSAVRFQLEQQLLEEEARLAHLGERLDAIDELLA
jgi:hypothetical protein